MQTALKQLDRLVRETTKVRDNLKSRIETAKAIKAEKKAAPKLEKSSQPVLSPKLKAVLSSLNGDPVLLDQVRALVRVYRKNGPGTAKTPATA